MICLKSIFKSYNSQSANAVDVLKGIDLELPSSGMVCLLGKSGSGKSTLLNIVGGLDRQDSGSYYFNGKDVSKYSDKEWDEFRNCHIGFVFQEFNLIENFTVCQNVKLPLNIQLSEKNNNDRICETLSELDISSLKDRKVSKLSGGQRQRVAIARALIKNPAVILADEPTGNLDAKMSEEIYLLLQKLSKQRLVFIVTHDEQAAFKFADRVIYLGDGVIIKEREDLQNRYSIKIDGKDYVEGTRAEVIDKYLETLQFEGKKKDFCVSIKQEDCMKNPEPNETAQRPVYDAKRFSLKDALSFAIEGMRGRKIRFLITIMIFTITSVLMYFGLALSTYNVPQVIKNYYRQYPSEQYYLYSQVEYIDDTSANKSKQVDSGKMFYNEITEDIRGTAVGILEGCVLSTVNEEYYQNVNAYVGVPSINYLSGALPKSGEIVITDYLADQLSLDTANIGSSVILLENEEYVISGYCRTGYAENDLYENLMRNPFDPVLRLEMERKYSVVYLAGNIASSSRYVSLQASDLAYADYFNVYLNTRCTFTSLQDNLSLIHGREPANRNEALISDVCLERFKRNGVTWEDLESGYVGLPDLYEDNYNNYYGDYINLFDYFDDGKIFIVGVYDSSLPEFLGVDVIIDQDIFDKISDDYRSYFIYDSFCLYSDMDSDVLIDTLTSRGIKPYEAAFNVVNSLNSLLNDLLPYILIIIIALTLIVVFLNITCIAYSIKDNSRLIGILRAIGLSKTDTLTTFIIQAMVLCTATILLFLLISVIGTVVINEVLLLSYSKMQFNILYFDAFVFLGISALIMAIASLSAALPIIRLANKHPVELIKSD